MITLGYVSSDLSDDERGLLVAPSRGSGSGVIVDSDGYIVTNAHVIEGAHRIQVEIATPRSPDDGDHHSILKPPSRLLPARVVATDDETDLAVIKIEATGLPTLDFASYYIPLNHQAYGLALAEAKKGGAVIAYGNFLTILLNFILLAFIVFQMVRFINRIRAPAAVVVVDPEEVLLLREIRDSLKR